MELRRRIGFVLARAIQHGLHPLFPLHLWDPKFLLLWDGAECGSLEAVFYPELSRRRSLGWEFRRPRLFPRTRLPLCARPPRALVQPRYADRVCYHHGRRVALTQVAKTSRAQGPAGRKDRQPAALRVAPAAHCRMVTEVPMARPSAASARPAFTAISASPFEFSYQNASPAGTSENVRRRARTRPATASRPSSRVRAARRPVIAF